MPWADWFLVELKTRNPKDVDVKSEMQAWRDIPDSEGSLRPEWESCKTFL